MQDFEYIKLRKDLREKVVSDLGLRAQTGLSLEEFITDSVNLALLGKHIELRHRKQLIEEIYNSVNGYDVLEPLLRDDAVSEIMVNRYNLIFAEKNGMIYKADLSFDSEEHLSEFVMNLYSRGNRILNLSHPIENLRLKDGSRANCVLPPVSIGGPVLTVRKFTGIRPDASALTESGFISAELMSMLRAAVIERKSIFICGGTGSGKTTLLNVLSNFIPETERIISIEDSAELQLKNVKNLVRLECRISGPEGGEINIKKLIKTALRMRPDRIIVGEVRGEEAFDLMTAMNSGHPGSLSTGHANSNSDMVRRLANMLISASSLPYAAILENIASAIDLMVHIKRSPGGMREVDEISELLLDSENRIRLKNIYRLDESKNEPESSDCEEEKRPINDTEKHI